MAKNNPQWLIVHHTLTARDTTTFKAVDNYHKKLWGFESSLGHFIGYHYFINVDGVVTQGRADYDVGAHTKQQSMNFKSIGICLAGNFDNEMPSEKQTQSLSNLLMMLMSRYGIPQDKIVPHRYFATYKSCYGNNLGNTWARDLVIDYKKDLIKHLERALSIARGL